MISSDKMLDTCFLIDDTWILEVAAGCSVCAKHVLTTKMAGFGVFQGGPGSFAPTNVADTSWDAFLCGKSPPKS